MNARQRFDQAEHAHLIERLPIADALADAGLTQAELVAEYRQRQHSKPWGQQRTRYIQARELIAAGWDFAATLAMVGLSRAEWQAAEATRIARRERGR